MVRRIIAAGIGLVAITTTACTTTVAGTPAASAPAPTTEQLRAKLLTSDDLAPFTNSTWTPGTSPDNNSDSSTGCPALDSTALGTPKSTLPDANVTLTDSHGEMLAEDIAYDPNAAADMRQFVAAMKTCTTFTIDGQTVPIRALPVPPIGDSSTAVEADVSGVSVAVLTFSHGNYVVALVMNDSGYTPTYFQTIEQTALNKLDHA